MGGSNVNKTQQFNDSKYSGLAQKMQTQSLVKVDILGAHKPGAMKNMMAANVDLATSKLYMDDDQMKYHKQHQ